MAAEGLGSCGESRSPSPDACSLSSSESRSESPMSPVSIRSMGGLTPSLLPEEELSRQLNHDLKIQTRCLSSARRLSFHPIEDHSIPSEPSRVESLTPPPFRHAQSFSFTRSVSSAEIIKPVAIRPKQRPQSSMSIASRVVSKQKLEVRQHPYYRNKAATPTVSRTVSNGGFTFQDYQRKLPHTTREAGVHIISCETVADLLGGKYSDQFDSIIIVDCRYEYEYKGGHIIGSMNLTQPDEIYKRFFERVIGPPERTALIFHCEFSKNRGPRACQYMRRTDRVIHALNFPRLYYPELYVMGGGYKRFFELYPQLCEPQGYIAMSDPRFLEEERYCSKQWKRNEKLSRSSSPFGMPPDSPSPEPQFPFFQCPSPASRSKSPRSPESPLSPLSPTSPRSPRFLTLPEPHFGVFRQGIEDRIRAEHALDLLSPSPVSSTASAAGGMGNEGGGTGAAVGAVGAVGAGGAGASPSVITVGRNSLSISIEGLGGIAPISFSPVSLTPRARTTSPDLDMGFASPSLAAAQKRHMSRSKSDLSSHLDRARHAERSERSRGRRILFDPSEGEGRNGEMLSPINRARPAPKLQECPFGPSQ